MNQFTERADIERKRKAAAAQRQMLGTFLSGSAAGTLDPQSIINAMALGALPPEAGNAMLAQMEKARLQQMADEAVVGSGAGALEDLERLRKTIDEGGMVTGFSGWLFSKIPFSEASAARTVADTLRSGMALGALRELKAGGATLGSVSAPELELLESAIARLNLNVPRKKVLEQMATIERHYKDAVRRSYKKASEEEKRGFDVYFGGTTPAWVLDPSAPDPTKTIDPTIDDLSEEEKRRLGLD
jgi:ribosomal protein S21